MLESQMLCFPSVKYQAAVRISVHLIEINSSFEPNLGLFISKITEGLQSVCDNGIPCLSSDREFTPLTVVIFP